MPQPDSERDAEAKIDEVLEKYKRGFTGNPGIFITTDEARQAIMRLITEARIDEVEKALVAGSIRTVPTDKGNNVEWWPDGLNKTLNNRIAQLHPNDKGQR